MTTPRLFAVTVALTADGARADLMAMAAVLHRRGVEVVEAEFGRPSHSRRVFSATFVATSQQAWTVQKTYEGLVDVVDTSLFEALDARSIHELSVR